MTAGSSARVVAGIDIGNSTTEIVLARVVDGVPVTVWNGQGPTIGRKGSAESVRAAAALLGRGEVECGVRADAVALAEIRPVETAVAVLPEPPRWRPVRSLASSRTATPAGRGWAVGRAVALEDVAAAQEDPDDLVVTVAATWDFDDAAAAIRKALALDVPIVGVLLEADEAVLVSNRIGVAVPVVDQVDLRGLAGARVAVEVVGAGETTRHLTDPLAVSALLDIAAGHRAALAEHLRDLGDSTAIALTKVDGHEVVSPGASDDWVETPDGRTELALVRDRLGTWPPGTVTRIRIDSVAVARDGLAVADAWAADLRAVDDGSWLRRDVVALGDCVLALLNQERAEHVPALMAQLTGRPATVVATEHGAAARGARSTPGFPADALVCDVGAGTVDCVPPDESHEAAIAAGGGELVTRAVSRALGIPRALAERVKRTASMRIEGPHVAHGEDGRRSFLDRPAGKDIIGRLCVRAEASALGSELVAFTDRLAPEEWRSLRLALKRATVGASIGRALAALAPAPTIVLAGGGALDDELVRSVTETLRLDAGQGVAPVVARADVAGRFGPRFAVAWGLVLIASELPESG